MDAGMNRIVASSPRLSNSINEGLLRRYTTMLDKNSIHCLDWNKVKHLHILSQEGESDLQKLESRMMIQPGIYVDQEETWVLILGGHESWIKMALFSCWDNLELLDIRFTRLKEINLSGMSGLKILWIRENRALTRVEGLELLTALRDLDIRNSMFATLLDIKQYGSLERLSISNTLISLILIDHEIKSMKMFTANNSQIINSEFLEFFPNLVALALGGAKTVRLPRFEKFKKLASLYLRKSPVSSLEKAVFPKSLRILNLSATQLRLIPESIKELKLLECLDLSDLKLRDVPDWLPELGLDFHTSHATSGIVLENTEIDGIDMDIFDRPLEMIRQWFHEHMQGSEILLNEIKVVFLGNGEVGKTHTIARLMNDGGYPPQSFTGEATPGIVIKNKEYLIGGQTVQVNFWDFGGQEILYSMHHMFLTRRTLYVILLDARSETKGTQAREWLDTVKSFAEDAPILLVMNKIDQNPSASIDETGLMNKYVNLKRVISMSALTESPEDFNRKFTDTMLELIRKSGVLEIKWPRKWTQVKAGLQNMKTSYISSREYEELCRRCNVMDNRENLLEWFNDLGVSFCQCHDFKLKDYVILKPDWITNAIYTILFNKRQNVENGMLTLAEINSLLNPAPDQKNRIRRVLTDVSYTWEEIRFVLDVVRKFALSYSVDSHTEFFPMLCKENSKKIAQEYAAASDTLEFQMRFEYLPGNVLHRLMVERWRELDQQNIWRTGAHFVQPNTGLSAVVRIDKNVLQIYVRSDQWLHAPNTYLSILEGSVDRIRKELNLPKPQSVLVYKVGDRRTEFDYERLLKMYARGHKTEYSHELDDDFEIRDILNQFAPEETMDQEILVERLVKACAQLQGDKHNWGTKEDTRNNVIRNALDNMGYIIRDQTRQGVGSGELEDGELDLDIRKYKDIPWTICEALRISSTAKANWNAHLKKLLDNYNPNGLHFLVLLTYVDDEKDKFDQICNSFDRHIQSYDPEPFTYKRLSYSLYPTGSMGSNHYIRVAKCQYRYGNYVPTVYHVFVRMGR